MDRDILAKSNFTRIARCVRKRKILPYFWLFRSVRRSNIIDGMSVEFDVCASGPDN
jgi:hypothetical protein